MFLRLWHDAFVGSDDEQRGINSPDTREHVLDEVPMTRNIHNANFLAVWKREPSEAKLDGHLARLFFFKTIGVYTRQYRDERGLAMMNMTCCSDNAHRSSKTQRRLPDRA